MSISHLILVVPAVVLALGANLLVQSAGADSPSPSPSPTDDCVAVTVTLPPGDETVSVCPSVPPFPPS